MENDRNVVQSINTGITNIDISKLSEEAIALAFGDPNTFYEIGNLILLVKLINTNSVIRLPEIPQDSLERALRWSGNAHNYPLLVTYRILSAVFKKDKELDISLIHLHTAAKESFEELHDPDLAITLLELAKSWGDSQADTATIRMRSYLINDLPLLNLTESRWQDKSNPEKSRMVQQLKSGFKRRLTPPSKAKIALCIADIDYSLNKTRQYVAWYKKAIAQDPTLRKDTPAGFRLETGRKLVVRINLLIASYMAYFAVFCFVLFTFMRHWRAFNFGLFFRRLGIFIPIYVLIACIVFILDFKINGTAITRICNSLPEIIVKPVVPLSVLDTTCASTVLIILLLGFIPVLLGLLFSSFNKHRFTYRTVTVLLSAVVFTWIHFSLIMTDNSRKNKTVWSLSHLYFTGELEDLLEKCPLKVIKANPNIINSTNEDFREFVIDKNIPGFTRDTLK